MFTVEISKSSVSPPPSHPLPVSLITVEEALGACPLLFSISRVQWEGWDTMESGKPWAKPLLRIRP